MSPSDAQNAVQCEGNGSEGLSDCDDQGRSTSRPTGTRPPWTRDPSHTQSKLSPEDFDKERANVIQYCLKKINTPRGLALGKNRRGEDMTLNQVTEEMLSKALISVRLGQDKRSHKTWKTASAFCMKHLSMAYGQHNVGGYKAWQTREGSPRPPLNAESNAFKTDPFCDNIVLGFNGTCSESNEKPYITAATELMNLAGLTRHKSNSKKNSEVSFHPTFIGKNKIKVSLANVSLLTVEVIRAVMTSELTTDQAEDIKCFTQWIDRMKTKVIQLSLDLGEPIEAGSEKLNDIVDALAIREMFKLKNRVKAKLFEFDITYDLSGCLDSDKLLSRAKQKGYTAVDHRCGLNCVKLQKTLAAGPSTSEVSESQNNAQAIVYSRTYNKWLETWQQGFARLDDISCKSAYSLNPSTTSLREALRLPDIQKHGITRNELTFCAPYIPSMSKMIQILNGHTAMVSQALVSCSLVDQLSDMENFVQRSVLVFWPDILAEKLRLLRKPVNDSPECDHSKQPEGGLIRWYNGHTRKFNGLQLLTPLQVRTTENSSWDGLIELAALGTTCKSNPILFYGVSGHDQFFESQASSTNSKVSGAVKCQHLWFLRLELRRIGETELLTYLPYHSDFKTDNSKNMSTSFDDVGVDLDKLQNIRPACLSARQATDYSSIKLDVEAYIYLNGHGSQAKEISEVSSEVYERVLGCPKSIVYIGKDLKHLPEDFTPWTKVKVKTVGRGQVVDFQIEGFSHGWYRVPKPQTAEIKKLVDIRPDIVCLVKRRSDAGGLLYQIAEISASSGTQPVNSALVVVPSNSKSAKELPVGNDPMTIIGAKYDSKTLQVALDKVGNFFIPKSVATQILESEPFYRRENLREVLSKELVGYQLLHTESRNCYVKWSTNKEELVEILDKQGNKIASNKSIEGPGVYRASNKRLRNVEADPTSHSEGPFRVSRKQRR
jgi:hypothetical protein